MASLAAERAPAWRGSGARRRFPAPAGAGRLACVSAVPSVASRPQTVVTFVDGAGRRGASDPFVRRGDVRCALRPCGLGAHVFIVARVLRDVKEDF